MIFLIRESKDKNLRMMKLKERGPNFSIKWNKEEKV